MRYAVGTNINFIAKIGYRRAYEKEADTLNICPMHLRSMELLCWVVISNHLRQCRLIFAIVRAFVAMRQFFLRRGLYLWRNLNKKPRQKMYVSLLS